MKFIYEVEKDAFLLRTYLKSKGFSRRLLNRIKNDKNENFLVDGVPRRLNAKVVKGEQIEVLIPPEERHPRIIPSDGELNILYEDEHLLILNKDAGLLSTVSWDKPDKSITNRVLGYYLAQGYSNQRIHLVTRLDRYTSGAMIIAKHQLAHAKMDQLLRESKLDKEYYAIVPPSKEVLATHGFIDKPIGRSENSIIEREISKEGKESLTEYHRVETFSDGDILKVKLHTGRTHQIRVHFSALNLPLIGDTLYGGTILGDLERQGLHCTALTFKHPFTDSIMKIKAPLAEDIKKWLQEQKSSVGN